MLGNDTLGDCVFAALAHACMAIGWKLKTQPAFTRDQVVKWYLDWDKGSDSGAVIDGVLLKWRDDEFTNTSFYGYGVGGPFCKVDPTNVDEVCSAIATFGCVLLGAELQLAQEDQFRTGQRWYFVPGSPTVGGHCVVATGFNDVGPYIVTWGKGIRATWAWVTNVCDEAYTGVFPATLQAGRYIAPLAALDRYCSGLPNV